MKKIEKIFDKKKAKKKKVSIFGNMAEGWIRFQELDTRALQGVRNFLSFLLIADLFLVFWYFKLNSLGTFLFILIIVFLILTLIAERRKSNKMEENKDKTEEKKVTETKEEEHILDPIEDIAGNVKKEIQDTVEQMEDEMSKIVTVF